MLVKQKIEYVHNSKIKNIKEIFKKNDLISKSCPMRKGDLSHSRIIVEYCISNHQNYRNTILKLKELGLMK